MAVFAYYNIVECPPATWDNPSMATFVFMLLGLPATITWDIAMADAFVKYHPYSLETKVGVTTYQIIFQGLFSIFFMAGLDPLIVPQALVCSTQPLYHYKMIAALFVNNIMGCPEQFYAIILQFSWLNDLIFNCKTVLAKPSPSLEEIKAVLAQYEQLKDSVQWFLLMLYTPLQIFTIFAFFVGTRG